MRIVVAPDSFGGTLSAAEAATAIIDGWRSVRPDDEFEACPMSDGGEGFLAVVAAATEVDDDDRDGVHRSDEVVGPMGQPVSARWLLVGDTAFIESALANGLALVAPDARDPLRATSWGVGELLVAARRAGATRIVVGLGGSATVDGGAGALSGLGHALAMADGSGLKVGGGELHRVATIEQTWVQPGWDEVDVDLLADVGIPLAEAAPMFGPQKGADEAAVDVLTAGLAQFATVVERDLGAQGLSSQPGTGAAGGLGFGLAAGVGARLRAGAPVVASVVGLDDALRPADLVITGEGRVDATTSTGKVVAEVAARAEAFAVELAIVAGSGTLPDGVAGELSAPDGPLDAAAEVAAAAARLAGRWTDCGDPGAGEGSR